MCYRGNVKTTLAVVIGLLIGLLIGLVIGIEGIANHYKRQALERGYAHYNPVTGEWEWNEKEEK